MRRNAWVNNGTEFEPHYNFTIPSDWSKDKIDMELKEILHCVESNGACDIGCRYEWMDLLRELPQSLLEVLCGELREGNVIISIASENWPNSGSIVVTLRSIFRNNSNLPASVNFREVNDPHYCKQEICQRRNDIEYLLIS
jgi:hypothetical protein